ncbi:MAG: sigma-54-dependent Fis family transcriptional regulator [Marinicaulis sp.]|nr:sigma-54 dependent transcriptional regulator [Marinicaulis sp.]NNE42086.1 sigma-54-dependent Fis family transcriptional regulator [Marinicaulis sp.]NNL89281.1 sigma-54-dependent Fis family transcriptional regulator [Marinicaulis sp.]
MRLLIIGEHSSELSTAAKIAMDRGARVSFAPDNEAGLSALRKGHGADLVMIDVRRDVEAFIKAADAERIAVPVVACGVKSDADAAVAAIRAGAKEYVPLPPDAELIAAILEAVVEESSDMIVVDPAMKKVVTLANQVAASEASILITGESGVGKEVVAKYVHAKSKRAEKPFISINCAAIPDNLLESELFGHEKGAFTGAVARRIGKFEEADGGTLLLDEISEMDIRLQAKLLRVLQERVVDRVGGGKPIKVDIRIIATSNRDLADEVRKKTFREDLFFRLNVVNLDVPPLRKRPADIIGLANHFIQKYAELNSVPHRPLSEAAQRAAAAAQWPGNVRELENTMHRAVLLSEGDEIGVDAIRIPDGSAPVSTSGGDGGAPEALVGQTVAQVEQALILQTLDHCLGNRTHAANILGISIRTLRNKLKQYTEDGVPVPAPGAERQAG